MKEKKNKDDMDKLLIAVMIGWGVSLLFWGTMIVLAVCLTSHLIDKL